MRSPLAAWCGGCRRSGRVVLPWSLPAWSSGPLARVALAAGDGRLLGLDTADRSACSGISVTQRVARGSGTRDLLGGGATSARRPATPVRAEPVVTVGERSGHRRGATVSTGGVAHRRRPGASTVPWTLPRRCVTRGRGCRPATRSPWSVGSTHANLVDRIDRDSSTIRDRGGRAGEARWRRRCTTAAGVRVRSAHPRVRQGGTTSRTAPPTCRALAACRGSPSSVSGRTLDVSPSTDHVADGVGRRDVRVRWMRRRSDPCPTSCRLHRRLAGPPRVRRALPVPVRAPALGGRRAVDLTCSAVRAADSERAHRRPCAVQRKLRHSRRSGRRRRAAAAAVVVRECDRARGVTVLSASVGPRRSAPRLSDQVLRFDPAIRCASPTGGRAQPPVRLGVRRTDAKPLPRWTPRYQVAWAARARSVLRKANGTILTVWSDDVPAVAQRGRHRSSWPATATSRSCSSPTPPVGSARGDRHPLHRARAVARRRAVLALRVRRRRAWPTRSACRRR